jgi:DNA polymerase phi
MKDLLKLTLDAVRQTKRWAETPDDVPLIWSPAEWNDMQTRLITTDRFAASKGLHLLCSQITQAINGVHIDETKPKTSNVSLESAKSQPKRKAADNVDDVGRKKSKRAKSKKDKH